MFQRSTSSLLLLAGALIGLTVSSCKSLENDLGRNVYERELEDIFDDAPAGVVGTTADTRLVIFREHSFVAEPRPDGEVFGRGGHHGQASSAAGDSSQGLRLFREASFRLAEARANSIEGILAMRKAGMSDKAIAQMFPTRDDWTNMYMNTLDLSREAIQAELDSGVRIEELRSGGAQQAPPMHFGGQLSEIGYVDFEYEWDTEGDYEEYDDDGCEAKGDCDQDGEYEGEHCKASGDWDDDEAECGDCDEGKGECGEANGSCDDDAECGDCDEGKGECGEASGSCDDDAECGDCDDGKGECAEANGSCDDAECGDCDEGKGECGEASGSCDDDAECGDCDDGKGECAEASGSCDADDAECGDCDEGKGECGEASGSCDDDCEKPCCAEAAATCESDSSCESDSTCESDSSCKSDPSCKSDSSCEVITLMDVTVCTLEEATGCEADCTKPCCAAAKCDAPAAMSTCEKPCCADAAASCESDASCEVGVTCEVILLTDVTECSLEDASSCEADCTKPCCAAAKCDAPAAKSTCEKPCCADAAASCEMPCCAEAAPACDLTATATFLPAPDAGAFEGKSVQVFSSGARSEGNIGFGVTTTEGGYASLALVADDPDSLLSQVYFQGAPEGSFEGTPTTPKAGKTWKVKYSCAELAGQTVDLTVTCLDVPKGKNEAPRLTATFQAELNKKGKATLKADLPKDWRLVSIEGPGAKPLFAVFL